MPCVELLIDVYDEHSLLIMTKMPGASDPGSGK